MNNNCTVHNHKQEHDEQQLYCTQSQTGTRRTTTVLYTIMNKNMLNINCTVHNHKQEHAEQQLCTVHNHEQEHAEQQLYCTQSQTGTS